MKQMIIMLLCAFALVACSSEEDTSTEPSDADSQQTKEDVSVQFQNVDIKVKENTIRATGEAKVTGDTFYFTFEQGETVLVKETEVKLEKNEHGWGSFEIELELSQEVIETKAVPVIILYGKSEDGKTINQNYFPVDLSQQKGQQ